MSEPAYWVNVYENDDRGEYRGNFHWQSLAEAVEIGTLVSKYSRYIRTEYVDEAQEELNEA